MLNRFLVYAVDDNEPMYDFIVPNYRGNDKGGYFQQPASFDPRTDRLGSTTKEVRLWMFDSVEAAKAYAIHLSKMYSGVNFIVAESHKVYKSEPAPANVWNFSKEGLIPE